MKIYIIRHGETDANKFGLFQGWTDFPLNQFGVELAEATGRGLGDITFDAAFSSPLIRARQTAEIILRETGNKCPITFDERIKEINAGDLEGKSFLPENGEISREQMGLFFSAPRSLGAFPNGESVNDVIARTQDFLFELVEKNYGTVLVSTHGCALRCMLQCVYNDPDNFWHGHVPYNCVINLVEAKDGKLTLLEDDKVYYDEALCIDRYARH